MKTLFLLTAILITYSVTAQQTQVINYGYNARGELISIVQNSDSLTYIYDDAGNRITAVLSHTGIAENKQIEDLYSINCYPNPAGESIILSFTLPEKAAYTVDLYDNNSRFIRTVADEKNASGNKNVSVKMDGLAAGSYFIVFQSGGRAVVRKIIKL